MIKAAKEYAMGDISKCPYCGSYLDQGIPHGSEHLRVCANCKEIFWPLPKKNEPMAAGYMKAFLAEVDDHTPILMQATHYRYLACPVIQIKSALKQEGVIPVFVNDYGNQSEGKRIEPVVIINQH